jgi:hypothetical protein
MISENARFQGAKTNLILLAFNQTIIHVFDNNLPNFKSLIVIEPLSAKYEMDRIETGTEDRHSNHSG